jgi:Putative transposase
MLLAWAKDDDRLHERLILQAARLEMHDGQVTFRWRDSANGNQQKLMTLDAIEFMRRSLLHILPPGFVEIPIQTLKARQLRLGSVGKTEVMCFACARFFYYSAFSALRSRESGALFSREPTNPNFG